MGNIITTSSDDRRFKDSILANEIKKIITDQTSVYRNKPIKIHVAKACCRDVIRPGISKEQNNVVSIAFPRAVDPNDTRCKTNGICLETSYVGYQIDDDRGKYCGDDKNPGLAGYQFSTLRGGGNNSVCDSFMMDYCAKTLYDQGCLKMGTNSAGTVVPQFANSSQNKMCWDVENKMNYGPPECHCLNSLFGPNLNTWPAREMDDNNKNPYGLEGRYTSGDNNFSKYSLNIFKADKPKQFPRVLDARCAVRASGGDSSRSKAYTLAQDDNGNVSICLNQINITDSDIKNANFEDIKQENNCGGPPAASQPPSSDNIPVNNDQKVDAEKKAAADKKILDDAAAAKKKADDDAAAAKALLEAKAKADADAVAAIKAKTEADLAAAKAKADADAAVAKAKADVAKAQADAAVAIAKAKTDADVSAANAAVAAAVKAKTDADEAAVKAKNDADSAANAKTNAESATKSNEPTSFKSNDAAIINPKSNDEASIMKLKADADAAAIKAKADAAVIKAKADADAALVKSRALAEAETDAANQTNKNRMMIGGGILLVLIIFIIIFFMSGKSKPVKINDDE